MRLRQYWHPFPIKAAGPRCAAALRYVKLGLDQSTREAIGRRAKRILDVGRARFARKEMGMENARLLYYCDKDISPENVLLIGSRVKNLE
jgi:hypothetical protein